MAPISLKGPYTLSPAQLSLGRGIRLGEAIYAPGSGTAPATHSRAAPLADSGVQPLLLLLCRLGHADKPLVLGRVVDLPAIGDGVAIAVIIR